MAEIDASNWTPGTRYFTQIATDNHAGWLYIITILSFVYVIMAFVIRFVVKYGVFKSPRTDIHVLLLANRSKGMYGHDDWALLASSILAVGQYIAVLAGLSKGLGKSSSLLSQSQIEDIQRVSELTLANGRTDAYYCSQYAAANSFLYILAHCGSKISTGILTLRLFENGRARNTYLCWFLVATSAIFGLGSVLSLAIGCTNPAFPVTPGQDAACPNRVSEDEHDFAAENADHFTFSSRVGG